MMQCAFWPLLSQPHGGARFVKRANCFLQFLLLVQIVVDSIQMLMSVAAIHVKMEPLVSMGTTTSCVYAQMALKDKDVKIVSYHLFINGFNYFV